MLSISLYIMSVLSVYYKVEVIKCHLSSNCSGVSSCYWMQSMRAFEGHYTMKTLQKFPNHFILIYLLFKFKSLIFG